MNDFLRHLIGLPDEASTFASGIDHLHAIILLTTFGGAMMVGIIAIVLAIRYRERPGRRTTERVQSGWFVEGGLILGLSGLFVWWWWIGYHQFLALQRVPANAMVVYVTAKQWMWTFAYPDGRASIAILTVPAGRPIKLVMSSRDVIHGFYVPSFRLKHDVVPGAVSVTWFQAEHPGIYQLLCSQYCGTFHSRMRGSIVVLAPTDYARWLHGASPRLLREAQLENSHHRHESPAAVPAGSASERPRGEDMADLGLRLAARKGCLYCHTIDGRPHIGPTWLGLYNSQVLLANGTRVIADERYLSSMMMEPQRHPLAGYETVMPSYRGLLSDGDAARIVEFIRSLPAQVPRRTFRDPVPPIRGTSSAGVIHGP